MSGVDLAALTEAVHVRLRAQGLGAPYVAPAALQNIVGAVLEALPREWGVLDIDPSSSAQGQVKWCPGERYARTLAVAGPGRWRLVWRAVGPPIPAEDGSPRGSRHVLQPKPPGAGGGRVPGVGWMCSGCEWRFSYDVDESRVREVWQSDERHALPPIPADEPQDAP